ncbi:MAG: PD-(D/E)XK nuclease family protein [Brevinema sp.]
MYIEHKEFSIILENKIWAVDQSKQLKRYYEIVKQKWDVDEDKIYIIYLNLARVEPSNQSVGQGSEDKTVYLTLQKLRNSNKFLDISYAYHILRWLKQLSFKSTEHTLKSAIEQYIYNLEILTHQIEEDKNMKKTVLEIFEKTSIKDNTEECYAIKNIMEMYIATS